MSKTHTFSFSVSARALRNILIGFIVGAMLTSGVAFAAANSNKYTGCLSADGTLHKVDRGKKPTAACAASEEQVSWNNKGKRGKKGPQGNTGPTGPAGPAGPAGVDGVNGTDGRDGAQGPQGAPGLQGERGAPGLQGLRGVAGPKGDAGPQGPAGPLESGAIRSVRFLEYKYTAKRDEVALPYIARCGPGEQVLAGGYRIPDDDNIVQSSYHGQVQSPTNTTLSAWIVVVEADDVGDLIVVQATCATLVP